jgi:hypothetical protein
MKSEKKLWIAFAMEMRILFGGSLIKLMRWGYMHCQYKKTL